MKAPSGLREALTTLAASARLIWRLAIDPRVPARARAFAGGAVAYALIPWDLIPARLPVLGRIDDAAVLAMAALRLVRAAGDELVREHWDGDQAGLEAFTKAVETLESLMPGRLRRLTEAVAG
ncbi:MAG: DUF1232 domain-containing protein [Acidimicrobiia bacterium]|nr:MAG: DUF1232 domain-containing protein [Acidimicrobiia bacterium]